MVSLRSLPLLSLLSLLLAAGAYAACVAPTDTTLATLVGNWSGTCNQYGAFANKAALPTCIPYASRPLTYAMHMTVRPDGTVTGGLKPGSLTYGGISYEYPPLSAGSDVISQAVYKKFEKFRSSSYACVSIESAMPGVTFYEKALHQVRCINDKPTLFIEGVYNLKTGKLNVCIKKQAPQLESKLYCNTVANEFNYLCKFKFDS